MMKKKEIKEEHNRVKKPFGTSSEDFFVYFWKGTTSSPALNWLKTIDKIKKMFHIVSFWKDSTWQGSI